jgi:hypothetical protein
MNRETILFFLDMFLFAVFCAFLLYVGISILSLETQVHELQLEVESLRTGIERHDNIDQLYTNKTTAGLYVGNRSTFYVRTNKPADSVYRTMMHEYAHFVFYEELSEQQRTEWRNISNHSSAFVTGYAASSPDEDFAEVFTYSVKITPVRAMNVSMDKNKFLSDEVYPLLGTVVLR